MMSWLDFYYASQIQSYVKAVVFGRKQQKWDTALMMRTDERGAGNQTSLTYQ